MACNMHPDPDWVPGLVIERLGPLACLVKMTDHLMWKRPIDLLRELRVNS